MVLLMTALIMSGYFVPIEVMDYPYRDDPVYLAYMEGEDSWFVSITMSPDSGAVPFTGWVEFPGMLNPPKTYADFEEDSRILSIYSQYPFSANYYLARYLLGDECSLELLEAGGHDYYLEALERIGAAVDSSDVEGALESAWSVMYPGGNPYSREMCILLLEAGLAHADRLIEQGESPEVVMEWFEDIHSVAWNLTNDQLHLMILSPADYPEGTAVSLGDYRILLREYADLLLVSGETTLSADVISVIDGLEED